MSALSARTLSGKLAAGLAHDILNPLAGIAGAVDILSYELGPDHSRREILQQMRREVARVQDLLSDLMEYARPSPVQVVTADLNETAMHSVSMARRLAGDRAAQISFLPCETLPAIPHDPIQLQHALLSVLMNGVRAASEHGEVHLTIAQHDGFAMTFVEDSGPATSPGELEKMFRPFPGGRQRNAGLALPIAKRIVEAHGGRVEAQSAQGRGTTVCIWLPVGGDGA